MPDRIRKAKDVIELQVHDLEAALTYYGEGIADMVRECGSRAASVDLDGVALVLSEGVSGAGRS